LAPTNARTANLNPLDMADLVKDTKTLFNDQGQVAKQYKEGYMGRAAGFDFVENTLWPAHTAAMRPPTSATPRRHHLGLRRSPLGRHGHDQAGRRVHHRGRVLGSPGDQGLDRPASAVRRDR
jgi:hypothetical protein